MTNGFFGSTIFIYIYSFILLFIDKETLLLFPSPRGGRNYNKDTLLGIISKLNKIQGTNTTNAITIGSKIVQQNVIN